jgi:hypothetical protein
MPILRDPVTGLVSSVGVDPDRRKNSFYSNSENGAVRTKHLEYLEAERQGKPKGLPSRRSIKSPSRPSAFRISPDTPILLPNDGVDSQPGQECPNAKERPDLRMEGIVIGDELGHLVHLGSPFLNRLAQLCSRAKLRRCESPECVENRKRIEKLAPRCEWPGFRDWALQLLACQASLTGERRLTRPFFHMSSAVSACHWLLIDTKSTGEAISGLLVGAEKTKVSLEAFGVFEMIYWMLTIQSSFGLSPVIEGGWSVDLLPASITEPAVVRASQEARDRGICQNRFWNLVFATERQHIDLPSIMESAIHHPRLKHEKHQECTPAFCRSTTLDSTKVEQLHKCPDSVHNPCSEQLFFKPKLLNKSIRKGGRTVWSLSKPFRVSQEEPYIAISHIWSDGTGVGLKPPGQVNQCLFNSFVLIAKELKCSGIWWDTISIPDDPKLRKVAINDMHQNYANAECTVLHDSYLLNFEWTEDGAPCLALIFSPWLTRGWTALELIMSTTVKVLYKGLDGKPLIKDLDKDILAKDPGSCTRGHWIASTIIRRLRQKIYNVSDLMAILKPRSTSWPRDRMVIAGLLSRINNLDYSRQPHEITKEIVDQLAKLNPSSLHHGQPTITESGGWSWCPPSLYDMPSETRGDVFEEHTVGDNTCIIDKNGVLAGAWHWRPLEKEDSTSHRLLPNSQHLSTVLKIEDAVRRWEYCMLLRDNNMGDGLALLVLPVRKDRDFVHVKFVGSVREVSSKAGSWDSRFSFDFFKIGVEGDQREVKAANFYEARHPQPKSSSEDYKWIRGKLWMGDRENTGQLLIARYSKDSGIIEGFSLECGVDAPVYNGDASNVKERIAYANTELSISDEPVFRVRAKSGRGVDGDGTDDSTVAIRRVKPELSWPPQIIPALDRIYETTSEGQYSKEIFRLKNGSKRTIYAALNPKLFTPDELCPYKGIWTGRTRWNISFVLFGTSSAVKE